jgi:hypothetical protein
LVEVRTVPLRKKNTERPSKLISPIKSKYQTLFFIPYREAAANQRLKMAELRAIYKAE